jgi:fatty acid desaturase
MTSRLPELSELRDNIPNKFFIKSELHFVRNLVLNLSLLFGAGYLAHTFIPFSYTAFPIWLLYGIVSGTIATGTWVLGHECGHYAFSNSKIANNVLGWLLHTPLLVPFFAWQYSHKVHHSKNNNIEFNETHVPLLSTKYSARKLDNFYEKVGEDAFAIINILYHLFLGWPMYLLFGITGGYSRKNSNHFIPGGKNKLFPESLHKWVWFGTVSVVSVVFFMIYLGFVIGHYKMLVMYWIPYIIINCWLVAYTWLHHTDVGTIHYNDPQWDWLKGALQTIDRNYPWWINELHFHIGSTHVLHHIFSEIPHYNAVEATKYLKVVLGKYYKYDSDPILKSMYRVASKCKYVSPTDEEGKWIFK